MSQVMIVVPSVFIRFTDGKNLVSVGGSTVMEALRELIRTYPEIRAQLFSEDEQLLAYVQVFVNEDNIRDRSGLATELSDRDEVVIVPALAGG